MAKSYFYDENISDWRELVKGEQGERGPVGPMGPQGPAIDIETGLPISVDTTVGTRVFVGDTMIYGDTGWRDISGEITVGTPSTINVIRRLGNTVYLTIMRNNLDLPNTQAIYSLPQGFKSDLSYAFRAFTTDSAGDAWRIVGEEVRPIERKTGTGWFSYVFSTTAPWPTSLPGSPR